MSNKTLPKHDAKTESAPNQIPPLLPILMAVTLLIASYIGFSFLSDRTLTVNNKRVNVLVADSSSERALGLSGHKRMQKDQGMLFVFTSPSQYCFWMQDMKFPIDIVWLDKDKKVITIKTNVTPESYPTSYCPDSDAQYVLEVLAGQAEALGLKEGDQAHFKL